MYEQYIEYTVWLGYIYHTLPYLLPSSHTIYRREVYMGNGTTYVFSIWSMGEGMVCNVAWIGIPERKWISIHFLWKICSNFYQGAYREVHRVTHTLHERDKTVRVRIWLKICHNFSWGWMIHAWDKVVRVENPWKICRNFSGGQHQESILQRANSILHSASDIVYDAFCIWHVTFCIWHDAHYRMHDRTCIWYVTLCIVYDVWCMMRHASCIIHSYYMQNAVCMMYVWTVFKSVYSDYLYCIQVRFLCM